MTIVNWDFSIGCGNRGGSIWLIPNIWFQWDEFKYGDKEIGCGIGFLKWRLWVKIIPNVFIIRENYRKIHG